MLCDCGLLDDVLVECCDDFVCLGVWWLFEGVVWFLVVFDDLGE